ncbi:hypothetical protein [uncultured Alistipes sp.]|uniref:hypothetical protein n=1 Tax=uncultured Alistipes sp. TaxID=538949 RepID=UPI00272BE736|nr:hypothetical protein [uncultured Alistipes sp.]
MKKQPRKCGAELFVPFSGRGTSSGTNPHLPAALTQALACVTPGVGCLNDEKAAAGDATHIRQSHDALFDQPRQGRTYSGFAETKKGA